MHLSVLVGASALALVTLSACGDTGDGDAAPPSSTDGAGQPGGDELEFVAKDIEFARDSVSATGGEVRVHLVNDGQIEHTWVIEGREDDLKLDTPQHGDEDEGTISLEAGTYTYYCDVPGHRGAGMEGTLTVD